MGNRKTKQYEVRGLLYWRDRLIRLLYYLPMEMGDLMNASLKALLNEQYKLVAELREENKTLKEYNGELIENHKKDIDILCEENKKLKERIDELEKCNLNLQERLDNKEKVNKSLREELEKIKSTYIYDAKQVRDIC